MSALISDPTRRVAIKSWKARERDCLVSGEHYDAVLATVGYEPRSFAIPDVLGPNCDRRVAIEFPDQQTSSYKSSLQRFRQAGFEIRADWEDAFPPFVKGLFEEFVATGAPTRVAVDVSSMNRKRIAAVIEVLAQLRPVEPIAVELLYAPAVFDPPEGLPEGVISLEPVSAYYAGDLQPGATPVGLVGVGYEPNKAAGALSNLEIPCGAAYTPRGPNEQFHDAVLAANSALLEGAEQVQQIEYEVLDPFECIELLDGPIRSLLRSKATPVIVPLGPKIFALSSCLVAAVHHPRVQVWRASFDAGEHAIPREADRWVCGVEVQIGPTRPAQASIARDSD